MAIQKVFIKSSAYLTCLSHALSTETEEIMGLLLGYVEPNLNLSSSMEDVVGLSFIESVVILQRSVRQADRVEISPLQLSAATLKAEKLSVKVSKPIRVLGWYHSHPHITVQPSHVDIHTQANYQAMDPDFIGLIFSVFQQEANEKFANSSMICFQAVDVDGILSSRDIAVNIVPQNVPVIIGHCLKALTKIPLTLFNEEKELKEKCYGGDSISKIHNTSVFTRAMCQLIECCEMPCISAVTAYEKFLLNQLHRLQLAKEILETH
ncbi:hypothetical protein DAPPUDRAFT_229214 [Daphnia pulex]|uniref:MPN domain-containing protein n=1 Tax=Daphnia pulex TaxID=6669 RepID=E9HLV1_DAPPU|nr:hypothetical protein DAPPUDRAFT_229214 [Daphnia pulex]|eukprot:EFX67279.1 hypothetical protein DAPPUDRAFT_229214 [Daphnia pulex]